MDVMENVEKLDKAVNKLIAENDRYRKALEFYAEDGNWKYLDVMYDKGQEAKKALKGENHE